MTDSKSYSRSNPPRVDPAPYHELPYPLPPKPMVQSKTLWGTLVAVLGALLTALAFEDPETALLFLNDGFQFPKDLFPLLAILGWAWKEYGHRVSKRGIEGVVSSKD